MAVIILTYSLLSSICSGLIFLNYTLEKQRVEIVLIKNDVADALQKIQVIQDNLKSANSSLVFHGDLNINQLLLGILLLATVVGSGMLLYTCFSDPQTVTNQITSSNLNIEKLITSCSNNVTDSNTAATQAILKHLENLEAHLNYLDVVKNKITSIPIEEYANLAAGFSKSVAEQL